MNLFVRFAISMLMLGLLSFMTGCSTGPVLGATSKQMTIPRENYKNIHLVYVENYLQEPGFFVEKKDPYLDAFKYYDFGKELIGMAPVFFQGNGIEASVSLVAEDGRSDLGKVVNQASKNTPVLVLTVNKAKKTKQGRYTFAILYLDGILFGPVDEKGMRERVWLATFAVSLGSDPNWGIINQKVNSEYVNTVLGKVYEKLALDGYYPAAVRR